jgi:HEAT repeat protein
MFEQWDFDPISALIGAVISLLFSWMLYRQRKGIAATRDRIAESVRRLIGKVTATVEQRYRDRIAAWASDTGILANYGTLDQTFVLPPLLSAPRHPDPEAKEPVGRHPISWESALNGYHRILVAGDLGSGRTSLLCYLAYIHARQQPTESLDLPLDRLPIYLHLSRLDLPSRSEEPTEETEKRPSKDEKPPLERLAECALASVGAPAPYGTAIQSSLREGSALVLVDGWDELAPDTQREVAAWMGSLAGEMPENFWIVAVGPQKFAPLSEVGFVALLLDQWKTSHGRRLIANWATVALSERDDERPRDLTPVTAAVNSAIQQGETPAELTLRCWLFFFEGEVPQGRAEVFERSALHLTTPPGDGKEEGQWSVETVREALSFVGLTLHNERRHGFRREELIQALEPLLPLPEERPARLEDKIIDSVSTPKGALITPFSGPSSILDDPAEIEYRFTHQLWQAYFAGQQVAALPSDTILEHLEDAFWMPVTAFYAALAPMEPVIKVWLSKPDDLWSTRLRQTAHWAASAPTSAKWRNGVMALLARKLLGPDLSLAIRRRVADALIQTGDPGVVYFLRQAAGHANPDVRIAALEALGHLAGEADLPTLEVALSDPAPSVQEASVTALGMMGNRAAVHRLTRLLVEAEQEIRLHAARALAHCGDEGLEILQEALEEEDILIRRAAVYGLGEIRQPWARERIMQVAHDDAEWIVRSAAETVIESRDASAATVVQPPIDAAEQGWLIVWAASRGSSVGKGSAALKVLVEALQHGPHQIRRSAVEALGAIGGPEHIPALRKAMEDEEAEVAAAAFNALEEISRRYGSTIRP